MKRAWHRISEKKGRNRLVGVVATLLAAVCFFAVSSSTFVAQAVNTVDMTGVQHTHKLAYTQAQLVKLLADTVNALPVADEEEATPQDPAQSELEQALQEIPQLAILNGYKGSFVFEEGQKVSQPEDVLESEALILWVHAQLKDKVLIQTVQEDDGCLAYVAMDTQEKQLIVLAVNSGDEKHAFTLEVEQLNGEMPATVQTYTVEPIVEQNTEDEKENSETSDEGAPVSSLPPTQNGEDGPAAQPQQPASVPPTSEEPMQATPTPATGAGALYMQLPLAGLLANTPDATPVAAPDAPESESAPQPAGEPQEPPADDSAASPAQPQQPGQPEPEAPAQPDEDESSQPQGGDDVVPQPTDDGPAPADPEQEPAEQQPQEDENEEEAADKIAKFEIKEADSATFQRTVGGVPAVMEAKQVGVITLQTGMLRGGPLDAAAAQQPRMRGITTQADMDRPLEGSVDLWTGQGGNNQRGRLSIYSKDQVGGQTPGYDYAIYSATPNVAYDIDANTNIRVYSAYAAAAAEKTFYIDLHNTQPVTIQSFDMSDATSKPDPADSGGRMGRVSTGNKEIFSAKVAGATLNITNPTGNAITYVGGLEFEGDGVLNASGDSWAISNFQTLAVPMKASAGFKLNATGAAGINAVNAVEITGAGTAVRVHDTTGYATTAESGAVTNYNAFHVQGALSVTGGAALQLENVTSTANGLHVQGTSNVASGGVLRATGNLNAKGNLFNFQGAGTVANGSVLLEEATFAAGTGDGVRYNAATTWNGATVNLAAGGLDKDRALVRSNTTLTANNGTSVTIDTKDSKGYGWYVGGVPTIQGSAASPIQIDLKGNATENYLAYFDATTYTFRYLNVEVDTQASIGGGFATAGHPAASAIGTNSFADSTFNGTGSATEKEIFAFGLESLTIERPIQRVNVTVDAQNSSGEALYLGRANLHNCNINLKANGTKPVTRTEVQEGGEVEVLVRPRAVMHLHGTEFDFYASNITIDAGSSPAYSLRADSGTSWNSNATLRLYNETKLDINREDSSSDAMFVTYRFYMYQESVATINSNSEVGRNLYVGSYLYMFRGTQLNCESNMITALPDDGGEGGEDGDDDGEEEPGEEPEEPGEGDYEGTVVENTELNAYRDEVAAVVYVGTSAYLGGYGESAQKGAAIVTIKGNASKQANQEDYTPVAFLTKGPYVTRLQRNSAIYTSDCKIGLVAHNLRLQYDRPDPPDDMPFASTDNLNDTNRCRVVAKGREIGMVVTGAMQVHAGSLYYGEGALLGIAFRNATYQYYGTEGRYATGRMRGATVIGVGTADSSTGIRSTQDGRFAGGTRVVAVGGKYGYELTRRASRVNIRYNSELIAVATQHEEGAGVYYDAEQGRTGTIYAEQGGKIYGYGRKYGVYGRNSNINAASTSSTSENQTYVNRRNASIIGIGGVDFENMEKPIIFDAAAEAGAGGAVNLAKPFAYADMPKPVLSKGNIGEMLWQEDQIEVPGVVPFKAGAAGIVTGGGRGRRIQADRNTTNIEGYGGEWGVVNDAAALDEGGQPDYGGYIRGYRGANVIGHGGKVGIKASTMVEAYGASGGRHAVVKGFGTDYGIHSITRIYSHGAGSGGYKNGNTGYLYGIGKINGVYCQGDYRSDSEGLIVGETWIDPEATVDEVDPETGESKNAMASPAIKTDRKRRPSDANASIRISNRSLVHEVYNPINMVFTSPPPYQFNTEFDAIGQNMGTRPERTLDYKWTTPRNRPQYGTAADGRDYVDYDPTDDQRLLIAGWGYEENGSTPRAGLISLGYKEDVDIVANAAGRSNIGNVNTNGAVWSNSGSNRPRPTAPVESLPNHRITIRGVKVRDLRTMKVEIDMRDYLKGANHDLTDIPLGTLFELDFTPLDPEAYEDGEGGKRTQTVALNTSSTSAQNANYSFNPTTGILTLHKLRLGEYLLRPRVQVGWPYQSLPNIPFVVDVDRRAEATGPGGFASEDDWPAYRWVESIFLGSFGADGSFTALGNTVAQVKPDNTTTPEVTHTQYDAEGQPVQVTYPAYTHAPAGHTKIDPPDDSLPTFEAPDGPDGAREPYTYKNNVFTKPSQMVGRFEIYYHRVEYNLNFKLLDSETWEPLRGQFTMATTQNGVPVSTLPNQTLASTGATTNWPLVPVLAGLEYEFTQNNGFAQPGAPYRISTTPNTYTPGSYKVRLEQKIDDATGEASHFVNVLQDNGYYLSFAADDTIAGDGTVTPPANYYSVFCFNVLQTHAVIPLELYDFDSYSTATKQLLANGNFELQVQAAAAEGAVDGWRTVSSLTPGGEGIQKVLDASSNPTGKFTFKARNGRNYRIVQTATDSGYGMRNGYYQFQVDGVRDADNRYRLTRFATNVQVEQGSHGWMAPTATGTGGSGYITNNAPIQITNLFAIGDVDIVIQAKGLWEGHDDAIFLVELRGTDATNASQVYYEHVSLKGNGNTTADVYGYKELTVSGTAQFRDIAGGNYSVTIYPALRTAGQTTGTARASKDIVPQTFNFTCENEAYLSGGHAVKNEIEIDFS